MGQIHQPIWGGSTTLGPASQRGSGYSRYTCIIVQGRWLMGWQESKSLAPCETPYNPNYVPGTGPTGGGVGGGLLYPPMIGGPEPLSPSPS